MGKVERIRFGDKSIYRDEPGFLKLVASKPWLAGLLTIVFGLPLISRISEVPGSLLWSRSQHRHYFLQSEC